VPFCSVGAFVSDPSIPCESRSPGRPCVPGNPRGAGHTRRKKILIELLGRIKRTPAAGGPLVPGSSRAFRARRASRRSYWRSKSPGPVRIRRGVGEGRFAFLLNRLFSCRIWRLMRKGDVGTPTSKPDAFSRAESAKSEMCRCDPYSRGRCDPYSRAPRSRQIESSTQLSGRDVPIQRLRIT
jgi:hypothetical protein